MTALAASSHLKRDAQQGAFGGEEQQPARKKQRIEQDVGLLRHGLIALSKRPWFQDSYNTSTTLLPTTNSNTSRYREPYPTTPDTESTSSKSSQPSRPRDPAKLSRTPTSLHLPPAPNPSFFARSKREQLLKRENERIERLQKAEEDLQQKMMARNVVHENENAAPISYSDYRGIVSRAYKQLQRAFPAPRRSNGRITFLDDVRSATDAGNDAASRRRFNQIMSNAQATLRAPLPIAPTAGLERLSLKSARNDKAVEALQIRRRKFRKHLDPDQQAYVKSLLSKQGVLSTLPGAEVAHKDMIKLKPTVWLNDEVINFYMIMINLRSKAAEEERKKALESDMSPAKKKKVKQGQEILKVHCFTSFFFTKLKSSGYDGVRRWTKKVDVFACDAILMPINLYDAHWVSACINLRQKRFEFYDSMGNYNQNIINTLRDWLVAEHLDKKKKPLDLSDWEDYERDDVPQQTNGYDCGIFTSQMLECCSRKDGALDFAQENMPYLRNKMIYEIGTQKFLDEDWD